MRRFLIKILAFFKGFVLVTRPHLLLGWLKHPFLTASNTLALTRWIAHQTKDVVMNDFYSFKRDYKKRNQLYKAVADHLKLKNEALNYLEFGVCGANSFKWWLSECSHSESKFYGFDTFEGLPEDWGTYSKGDMSANIPVLEDKRAEFIKGLFQDTLPGFLKTHSLPTSTRNVIHLDADLFSSTLFALTSLAPHLKKGDVLLFDEFNVPNHEFFAFKIFSDSFYVKTKLLGAVNNYYQVALIIE